MIENSSEFHDKAINYNLFRPEYPDNLSKIIKSRIGLDFSGLDIAELGCGTGKFTKILAREAKSIFALDKDKEMLSFTKQEFQKEDHVVIINAEAENSGLNSSSFDLVLSAQSFHHFDVDKAKIEIKRILRKNGEIFLLWYFSNMNQNLSEQIRSCFYRYGDKLEQKERLSISPTSINNYFNDWTVSFNRLGLFDQKLDRNSFIGSMCSSSYAPTKKNSLYESYIKEMNELFTKFENQNHVTLEFEIHSYYIKR